MGDNGSTDMHRLWHICSIMKSASDDPEQKKPRGAKPVGKSSDKKRASSPKASSPKTWKRARGGEAKAIADLMPEIGRTAFKKFGFVQSSVVTRWPEIAGERYAAISLPESIRFPAGKKSEGTLHLVVNGAHAVLMQHVTPEIITRVNRFFGYTAITKVKFRHGVVTPPKPVQVPRPPRPLKPVPVALGDGLRDIGDPELLAVLQSLASDIDAADDVAKKK